MKSASILVSLLLVSAACLAQQPKKIDNPRWKQVVSVKFHEGKMDRAMTIIKDYFEAAAKKANTSTPEMALRMATGKWDLVIIWNMKGGVDDLNWETSAEDVAWMKALGELAGGPDKGKAILEEYLSLIKESNSEIARMAL